MGRIIQGSVFGFIFGMAFPLVATAIAAAAAELSLSAAALKALHVRDPLLQVIDTMPLVMAMVFALVGRSRAEQEELIESLEARVAQRTRAVVRAKEAAEASLLARSHLTANLLTDAKRKQLCVMDLLDELSLLPNPPALRLDPKETGRHAQDVLRQLEDLGTLADTDRGTLAAQEAVRFDPNELLTAVTSRVASADRPRIFAGIDPDLPQLVEAERVGLQRVLDVALSRALALSGRGEVSCWLGQVPGVQGAAAQLHVEISTSEAEIDAEALKGWFRGYDELDPDVWRSAGSADLELLLARRVCDSIGGAIGASATREGGALLWVTLPFAEIEPAPSVESSAANDSPPPLPASPAVAAAG